MKMRSMAALAGVSLWLSHGALAALLAPSGQAELTVLLDPHAPAESVVEHSDRAVRTVDGHPYDGGQLATGMRHLRWVEQYGGGFSRSVATALRIGPFQSNDEASCGIRMRVGQALLDDGGQESPTIANLVRRRLTSELAGLSVWPVGSFVEVSRLALRFAENKLVDADGSVFGFANLEMPNQLIALTVELRFARARVPLFIGLIPELRDGRIHLRSQVSADVVGNNRVYRFVLDALGGDKRATKAVESELSHAVVELLAPPPPLELGGGKTIALRYCPNRPLVIRDGLYAELPLDIELAERGGHKPPQFPQPAESTVPTKLGTAIQVDIDANGLAALLHQLWSNGFLDELVESLALDEKFNLDETVQSLLSVRVSDIALEGPPVLEPTPAATSPGRLTLSAQVRLSLTDGTGPNALVTPARLFGRVDLVVSPRGEKANRFLRASGSQFSLTCQAPSSAEPNKAKRLRSCYGIIAGELGQRGPAFADLFASRVEDSFNALFRDRELDIAELGARFVIDGSRVTPQNQQLRLEVDGHFAN